jgi:predicted nucleic acid-binding protein
MSDLILFDTSVLIDNIRTDCHRQRIMQIDGFLRYSSVVLAELIRGASTDYDRFIIKELSRQQVPLTPTTKNWIESGEILARMKSDSGFQVSKLRDLHFDVLIALTARSHGACLITTNRADFELIREYRDFKLEVW